MKKLISTKQYKKALNLFNQQSGTLTNQTINMAIKACTKLHDYEEGLKIVQKLSSESLNDPYIQPSLIHFYSKSFIYQLRLSLFKILTN